MTKQELIKQIKDLKKFLANKSEYIEVDTVIELVSRLDEPQEIVVQQFVADWYEEHKDDFEYNIWDWIKYSFGEKKMRNKQFTKWIGNGNNKPIETLVKMSIYGYTVEKKKLVKVKLKGTGQYLCNDDTGLHFQHGFKTDFTKDYLEQANFGWVFECPGIEIEEVEE